MYSETMMAYAGNPQGRTLLPNANASGNSEYPPCGDRFTLSLRVEEGRIIAAGFQAQACGPTVAFASLACATIEGMTPDEALKIDSFRWDIIAGGLPPAKRHAIFLFLDALDQALVAMKTP